MFVLWVGGFSINEITKLPVKQVCLSSFWIVDDKHFLSRHLKQGYHVQGTASCQYC